ncbi:hypothetical protein TDB9533_01241 [Thalassocella blandensis]|nr:hypothetical protein TDB9533_01241 [Thalassocella blandensis]
MSDSELDKIATHAALGRLVGVSKQAIQKKADEIGLTPGATLREWLLVYCEHQRNVASGRGGDSQSNLTEQRYKESQQKTMQLQLANMQALGHLCLTVDVIDCFRVMGQGIPRNLTNAGDRIIEAINSQYDIKLDDELILKPLRIAADRIAADAKELGERFRGTGGNAETETTDFDS